MAAPDVAVQQRLSLVDLTKRFGDQLAVDEVNLTVEPGEFLTLLGPSGSGKSTTLNMIAGFVPPSAGTISIGDRPIAATPAHRRDIGVVFQDYALFPHMTAFENVAFPLRRRGVRGAELRRAVEQALALVRLDGVARSHPGELSGGQRQRVALARAVVFGPGLLLLDEALGALDRRLREALQHEIRRIHRELGVTCVHITHDQEEALSMSDRVAVMRDGRIEQVGRPRELYEEPASLFVARFVGDANVITGRYDAAGGPVVAGEGIASPLPEPAWASSGASVTVVVRPERIRLSEPGGRQVGAGTVREVAYLGAVRELVVEIDGGASLLVSQPAAGDSPVEVGSSVGVSWEADDVVAFAAE